MPFLTLTVPAHYPFRADSEVAQALWLAYPFRADSEVAQPALTVPAHLTSLPLHSYALAC